jgi:DNA topoisomerase IA
MQTLLWALGIIVTLETAIIAFVGSRLWTHVVECHSTGGKVAALERDVERMKEDIGTHDTGMRGAIQHTATMVLEHELKLNILERRRQQRNPP